MKSTIALLLTAVTLTGCFELDPPAPVETKKEDAQALVDAMQYVRAKNGLCFGVSTVERTASNGNRSQNTNAVHVPCDKVGLDAN